MDIRIPPSFFLRHYWIKRASSRLSPIPFPKSNVKGAPFSKTSGQLWEQRQTDDAMILKLWKLWSLFPSAAQERQRGRHKLRIWILPFHLLALRPSHRSLYLLPQFLTNEMGVMVIMHTSWICWKDTYERHLGQSLCLRKHQKECVCCRCSGSPK